MDRYSFHMFWLNEPILYSYCMHGGIGIGTEAAASGLDVMGLRLRSAFCVLAIEALKG
jgi:hypothetical protein